jgi:hypothetical protein
MQEGGVAKSISSENNLSSVPATAKRGGEVYPRWAWTEPTVGTERMLTALKEGVKGGVWFSWIEQVFGERTLRAAAGDVNQTLIGWFGYFKHSCASTFEGRSKPIDLPYPYPPQTGEENPKTPLRVLWYFISCPTRWHERSCCSCHSSHHPA